MTRAPLAVLAAAACLALIAPAPASASVVGKACGLAGGLIGKACDLASSPGKVLSAGKNLLTGHVGSALKDIFGGGSSTASTKLALVAVVAWVAGGAKSALDETANVLTHTTRPNLRTTWFSGAYWRMAGIAALLTLPFLFAAAIQALIRSDLSLLAQAALGYLPLAMLAVSIAAPVAMLLLAATDQLSGLVSSVGAGGGAHFLTGAGTLFGVAHFAVQPFITFLVAVIAAGGALILWLELAVREAAVYVIVLMLPLAFAALVWPARRAWAVRSVELLVALILSKFAIVAVLGLAGAALGHDSQGGLTTALAGTVLVLLAAFAPWALLRLVPLSELAAGAIGSLRPEVQGALRHRVRQDTAARETPPLRSDESRPVSENRARDAARNEVGGLELQPPLGASPASREGPGIAQPPAGAAAAEAVPRDHAPTAGNGRPAALAPVASSPAVGDQPGRPSADEPPEITLGPSSFKDRKWDGPVFDVLSGEPGEDHDPLPHGEEEDLL